MDVPLLLTIGAIALAAFAVITITVALQQLANTDASVNARLDTYLNDSALGVSETDLIGQRAPLSSRLNAAITRQSFAERIAQRLQRADLVITVPEYLLLRTGIPLVLAIIAILVWRDVIFVPIALVIGSIAPTFWMRGREQARNRAFSDQLADTLSMLVSSLRGGFSLLQGIKHVARESPNPTKSELERVIQEIQLGISINDALDHLVKRMESDDLDLIVTAIKINTRVGGNLAGILERISTTIRERSTLRREVRVITSMQRLSGYVVGLLPLGLALVIFAINPTYMARLFDPAILCIPIGAGVMSLAGFIIIQKIADIRV
jgi:tight adherence protein B